jgi:hypothetical protein
MFAMCAPTFILPRFALCLRTYAKPFSTREAALSAARVNLLFFFGPPLEIDLPGILLGSARKRRWARSKGNRT